MLSLYVPRDRCRVRRGAARTAGCLPRPRIPCKRSSKLQAFGEVRHGADSAWGEIARVEVRCETRGGEKRGAQESCLTARVQGAAVFGPHLTHLTPRCVVIVLITLSSGLLLVLYGGERTGRHCERACHKSRQEVGLTKGGGAISKTLGPAFLISHQDRAAQNRTELIPMPPRGQPHPTAVMRGCCPASTFDPLPRNIRCFASSPRGRI